THAGGNDGGRRAARRRVGAVGRPDQRHRLFSGPGGPGPSGWVGARPPGGGLSAAQISAIGLTLAGGLLVLVLRMRFAYSAALIDAVRDGNLEVFTHPQAGPQKPLLDADTQRALTGELNASEPGARAVAVSLLGRRGDGVQADLIVGALHDAAWRVRLAALQALFDQGHPEATDAAITMLGDSAPQVRSLAARSISGVGTHQAEP